MFPELFKDLQSHHYGAVLVDPPWRFKTWNRKDCKAIKRRISGRVHYQTLAIEQIASLPIAEYATPDCALFLWVSWPQLEQALIVIKAWGFTYKTCAFDWLKTDPYKLWALEKDISMGMGYWTRANTEACLLATRGKPKRLHRDVRMGIIEPRREHSRKPDCVHNRIEQLVSGPYLELFGRQQRTGWTVRGDQLDNFPVERRE
jgi:N6-adenosine-specific RNA methylase IME4